MEFYGFKKIIYNGKAYLINYFENFEIPLYYLGPKDEMFERFEGYKNFYNYKSSSEIEYEKFIKRKFPEIEIEYDNVSFENRHYYYTANYDKYDFHYNYKDLEPSLQRKDTIEIDKEEKYLDDITGFKYIIIYHNNEKKKLYKIPTEEKWVEYLKKYYLNVNIKECLEILYKNDLIKDKKYQALNEKNENNTNNNNNLDNIMPKLEENKLEKNIQNINIYNNIIADDNLDVKDNSKINNNGLPIEIVKNDLLNNILIANNITIINASNSPIPQNSKNCRINRTVEKKTKKTKDDLNYLNYNKSEKLKSKNIFNLNGKINNNFQFINSNSSHNISNKVDFSKEKVINPLSNNIICNKQELIYKNININKNLELDKKKKDQIMLISHNIDININNSSPNTNEINNDISNNDNISQFNISNIENNDKNLSLNNNIINNSIDNKLPNNLNNNIIQRCYNNNLINEDLSLKIPDDNLDLKKIKNNNNYYLYLERLKKYMNNIPLDNNSNIKLDEKLLKQIIEILKMKKKKDRVNNLKELNIKKCKLEDFYIYKDFDKIIYNKKYNLITIDEYFPEIYHDNNIFLFKYDMLLGIEKDENKKIWASLNNFLFVNLGYYSLMDDDISTSISIDLLNIDKKKLIGYSITVYQYNIDNNIKYITYISILFKDRVHLSNNILSNFYRLDANKEKIFYIRSGNYANKNAIYNVTFYEGNDKEIYDDRCLLLKYSKQHEYGIYPDNN